jgi:hypothetical protein
MQQTDTRKIAIAGVVVTAVLAACLALPAVDRISTVGGTWLAAAIFCLPTAAVLTLSGYRHYGVGRSVAVAVAVVLVTAVVTWVVAVFTVASAMAASGTGPVMGIVMLAAPALTVLILGLAALRLVPARPAAPHGSFEHAGKG